MKISHLLPLKWHVLSRMQLVNITPDLCSWLTELGSLTRRLQQISHNGLTVQVLSESWQLPRIDEINLLGCSRRQKMRVRNTVLHVNGQAWILARTVIPRATLIGKGQQLKKLNTRPLGEVLYQDRRLCRGNIQIAAIRPTRSGDQLWARRSVFYFYGRPLLVSEMFLPVVNSNQRHDFDGM